MKDLFSKISKAIDAFTDVLTEDVSSIKQVPLFRYSDFKQFVSKTALQNPSAVKCKISVSKQTEFGGRVFSEKKFVIRVLMLNENETPLAIEGDQNAYLGTIAIASAIDRKLAEFMLGQQIRVLPVKGVI